MEAESGHFSQPARKRQGDKARLGQQNEAVAAGKREGARVDQYCGVVSTRPN